MSTAIPFGTDGIRGPYGQYPLDTQSLRHIARTIAVYVSNGTVAIARDTRYSGVDILSLLTDELIQYGVHVYDCGVLPTAALACVVVDGSMDLGIVITASHNPAKDNGIKLFSSRGDKLTKTEQAAFQDGFRQHPAVKQGTSNQHPDPTKPWLKRLPKPNLKGKRILLDCAHGSLAPYGQEILEALGATVTSLASEPNGHNINDQVGALHPPKTIDDHDLALCFDGDADRLILCTPQGILDGDDILYLMKTGIQGPLIGTIMSNGGLESALDNRLQRSKVGDQHVAALMKEHNALLGAEPSGHIIFKDGDMPAGDGMYAALRILEHCVDSLNVDWERWPTAQTNVRFRLEKLPNHEKPALTDWNSIDEAHRTGHRTVVRYSGTEPKLRILVEGPQANRFCQAIAAEFQNKLDH